MTEMNKRLPVTTNTEAPQPQVSEELVVNAPLPQDSHRGLEPIQVQQEVHVHIPKLSVGLNSEEESVLEDEPSEAKKRKEKRADWHAQLFTISGGSLQTW